MRPTGQRVAGQAPTQGKITTPRLDVEAAKTDVVALATKPVKANSAATAKAPTKGASIAVTKGSKLPNIGYYPITVNGAPVKFDVRPRVENGVALTPFRHLFEHVGGKVAWQNTQKQVEAKGLGQNIVFQIGSEFATVNGGRMDFERAAFLESGRAVVPLSFVQQLLKVDVKYDAATKHVLITKSK